ncbi:uncharacterized protein SPPG_06977 [Spizellomyces punctatus DAOM BR117]|uniref:ABC transporter domain-containing protein n=1 Tax=Spizellomyces punctatus (strain DAOM BR117) TaxID=645134 RepID=A0A0L0HB92_SPIPD|nr:uncharacterized protein SPPG_06977 [Spizellomyces punctatus DAOM BR117]KNC97993.1 hypothetical protein SPPG_06977 [Spizellomyces punctatus DAOM BR117]|eukprot:XP_016606033.1 hypothetical protein SPPG_06977 [Spizellomyces punctatus DAOM BR117]
MPPKKGSKKKGNKDAWNADDDKKYDLKAVEDADVIDSTSKSAKKKSSKTSGRPVTASDNEEDSVLIETGVEQDTDATEDSRKRGKRREKKSISQNAFDLLEQADQDEDSEANVDMDTLGGNFSVLTVGDDDERGSDASDVGRGKSGKSSSRSKREKKAKAANASGANSADDGEANEEDKKEKKARKSREERKKEKAGRKKNKEVGVDGDGQDEDIAPETTVDDDRRSTPGAYSYASGQPLGPEGTNPSDAIAVTGNLLSPPNSRDLQVDKLTVQAFGKLLIKESELSLINGRRYGLIAPNGSGKSTLLHAIACGLVPMPKSLDVYLLDREFAATEMTSIEAVLEITRREHQHLMDEMTELLGDPDKHAVRLDYIQTRLGELEAEGSERRALDILKGLGFSEDLIQTKTKDLSGGWRMRISLARILFVKPTLMLLDEPTNHLDLEAVVWLEEYLLHNLEGHTVVMTSHSQDTLNEVCTDIIHLYHQHLDHYPGNYNTFTKVRAEKDVLLNKRARAQEKQMAKLKENLSKTGSKQQAQAKNRVKAMEKRQEKDKEKNKALEEELIWDKPLTLKFSECGRGLPPPVLKFRDVNFGYPGGRQLFHDLNFGIDLDSRIALVGPNGAGKSTLIKLMLGELQPTQGTVTRNHHLRIAQFHQHMGDQLDMDQSAVQWLCSQFKEWRDQDMRREVGKYGLTGKSQVIPMRQLSDGQRRRVIFAYLGLKTPHLFLMDEPTNALDIETIDALAEAINDYDGGVVFITHDFRLIDQVAKEIWIVRDGEVEEFDGDIRDYKDMLKAKYAEERAANE